MNNRTKRLYIVVPLVWVVVMAAAAWMASVRSPKGPGEAEEEEKALAPTSGVGRCVAAGIEMPAWGMSVPPARGKGEVLRHFIDPYHAERSEASHHADKAILHFVQYNRGWGGDDRGGGR